MLRPLDPVTLAAVILAASASLVGLIVGCAYRLRRAGPVLVRARIALAATQTVRAFALFALSALSLMAGFLPSALGVDAPSWLPAFTAVTWYALVVAAFAQLYRIVHPPGSATVRRPTPEAAHR